MESRVIIKCEGNAHDRGFGYGVQARESIQDNVETYRRLFRDRHGLEWERVRLQVGRVFAWIEEFDADLAEELRAIAEGSQVDPIDIVILNARSSITLAAPPDECTSVAYIPANGDEETTLIGQNWDNMKRLKAVVLRVIQAGKPEILTLTEAGTLAKIGLNDKGIGLCVNGLQVKESATRCIPIFVLIRKALQSTSLSEAMGVITKTPRDAPHNYKFASRLGAAFDIETLTVDFDILAPTGPFLIHTNHVLSPRILVRDELKTNNPDTTVRLWRAQRLVSNHSGKFGVSEMKDLLSDHFDLPNSICRHAEAGGNDLQVETKCSVIMEPAKGRMYVSKGPPCNTPLETFEFN